MQAVVQSTEANRDFVSGRAYWTSWIISGLLILFLAFDAVIKLFPLEVVTQTMAELGWPATASMARLLGVLTLICTILYAIPRTSVLGAILLTGYLGGAIATHIRIGNPLFSHTLFGVYLGIMAWGALYLRDPRVRALLPLRR
ncbi:DoxX family protein [Pseudaminobacter salicylatoxidans]|uniref:DoxX family protein n=1 Tax=Pseudaminobacter salicylatoxidans TaxID=93369 RepID=UPI0002E411C0|nr:DoxX family protein [Pseudaminobacter salicylatoxidans]